MSIRFMRAVWAAGDGIRGSALLVLLALADLADDDGVAYPSVAWVARAVRLDRRQTQRVMHRLIDDGWVEVVDDARGRRSRRYRIRVDRMPGTRRGDMGDTDTDDDGDGRGDIRDTATDGRAPRRGDTGDTCLPCHGDIPVPVGVTPATRWGDAGDTQPVITRHDPSHTCVRAREDVKTTPPDDRPHRRRPMPPDYTPSPAVRAWAAARGYDRLDEHLDHLRDVAAARAYRYADWDAVLRRAVREDWARLREPRPGPHSAAVYPRTDDGWLKTGRELGIAARPGESMPEYINRIRARLHARGEAR